MDRRPARDAPARGRVGDRPGGAAAVPRWSRGPRAGAGTVTAAEDGASRLIALDIDGTVLHEDGGASPRVRRAVRAAAGAGHEVMLATGRS
ncbi:MAG TPA: HAD hydrolase family protein, partial [Amnibacterium sp.]|nr:HAD hydrolase family protein [Amnibacterium sp.]